MSKFELIFRFLFYSLCLSLCLYQISDICKIYFSYKTTTFVSYGNQSEISLPAITFCTDKQNLLNPEYLDQLLSESNEIQNNTTNDNQIKEMLSNMTVRAQFDALYDFKQLFNDCLVLNPIGLPNCTYVYQSYCKCENVVPIRRSIDYNR